MIYALVSLLLISSSWIGWGLLALRALGLQGKLSLPEHGFAGVLAIATAGNLLHLFAPLSNFVTVPVCVAGVAAALVLGRRGARAAAETSTARAGLAALVALLLAALAVSTSLGGPIFDTGLYHAQAILWLRDYPLAPGLANLEPRLGFNSSWFTVAVMAWLPWLEGQAVFAVNGALVFLFCWALLLAGLDGRPGGGPGWPLAALLLTFFSLAPAGREILYGSGGSSTTDVPAAVCTLLAFVVSARARDLADRALLLTLCLLAISIKLSQAPLLLLPALAGPKVGRRPVVLLGAAVAIWLLTGWVTSGCLLYPLVASCLPGTPWVVSPQTAASTALWVSSWARKPGSEQQLSTLGSGWLDDWWQRFVGDPLVPQLALLGLLGLLLAIAAACRGPERGAVRRWLLLPLVAAAGVAFWFLRAPDLRFGLGFVAALPLSLLAVGLAGLLPDSAAVRRGRAALLSLAVCALAFEPLRVAIGLPAVAWSEPRPLLRAAHVDTRRTRSGLEVQVPLDGEQGQCWGAPPPCTSELDPALRSYDGWGRAGFCVR